MEDILPVLGTASMVVSVVISFFSTVWQVALQRFSDAKLEDLVEAKERHKELDTITKYPCCCQLQAM